MDFDDGIIAGDSGAGVEAHPHLIMESIINRQLLRYLEDHQLLNDQQYGFRSGRSAGDLLVYLTHNWATAIETKGEALAVNLDIAKAFDRVWHKTLLSKLPSYGLPAKLCAWVTSFLTDRSIKVIIDGECPDLPSINAGVPQGSMTARRTPPISVVLIFLGKASLRAGINLCLILNLRLRKSLTGVDLIWSVCAFTAKKAPFVVSPCFQNIPLTVSANIEILGVDISSEVQFRGHLEDKAKLASKKFGVLNRSRQYFTPAHRLQLYKAQVRPHMEYCSHLWAGAPQY
ncbi:unnamed protein product [Diatraea saccharalis]|uniref:Reverse transcriptase domain-containing protein n=1 Tax=Diatraea saccharalis TaxID=40085 RepID=A0A9N9QUW8_9NEOP|nr:unnamed protein product [Diatraea saccharalis]